MRDASPSPRVAPPWQDELLFEPLRDPMCREAFGVDFYVLFPTMVTSPVFARAIWEQRTSSYPSIVRTFLQTRDCVWYLLVQLNLVGFKDVPPDAKMRRQFYTTLTQLGELEAAERRSRHFADVHAAPPLESCSHHAPDPSAAHASQCAAGHCAARDARHLP